MSPPTLRRRPPRPQPQPQPVTRWETADGDRVTVYPGRPAPGNPQRWYWHATAPNGRASGDSGRGFLRRRSAIRAARRAFPQPWS